MFSNLIFFAPVLIGLTGAALVLGPYMAAVYQGRVGALRPVENALYRLCGISGAGQQWTGYARRFCCSTRQALWFCISFWRTQQWLPVNPQGFGPMSPDQAFNTAISFVTDTNWQS